MRQAIIYPGEDGFWVGECSSLPGCISQGKTKEEAIKNIREAIDLYIEALKEDNAERGQVTIPKKIRVQFGIQPGTVLDFQDHQGQIIVTKVTDQNPVDEVYGALGSGRSADEMICT